MPSNSTIISSENISIIKNRSTILSSVSISFSKKSLNTIIGLNGSGKSTLLRALCNLENLSSGSIFIDGKNIRTLSRKNLAKNITFLPQNIKISAPFTVKDIVFMSRFPYKKSFFSYSNDDKKAVYEAMKLTNILKFEKRDINSLSGGERQKVFLASALAQETPILLLDEPFNSLDIKATSEIIKILLNIKEETDKTIILALHDISLAKNISDTITALTKGKVIFSKPSQEVTTDKIIKEVFDMEQLF